MTMRPRAARRAGRNACVGQLADDVHFELASKLCERQVLERGGDGDAGVVDEPVEPLDALGGRSDGVRIGDVEEHLLRADGASPGFRTPASTRAPRSASGVRMPRRSPSTRP